MVKMPTVNDKMEASYIIQVLLSCGLRKALSYKENRSWASTYFEEWMDHAITKQTLAEEGLKIYSGASKICIVSDNENWVIKIGFLRETNTMLSADLRDYCEREALLYQEAIKSGCETHLAATYYGGCIDGIEFYLQERVVANVCVIENRIKTQNSTHNDTDYEDCDGDDEYIRAVINDDNDEEVEDLIEFAYEHDINDLHCGNWGIAKDGRVVIIDFSGFLD